MRAWVRREALSCTAVSAAGHKSQRFGAAPRYRKAESGTRPTGECASNVFQRLARRRPRWTVGYTPTNPQPP
jgi:hypothetical protein